MTTDSTAAVTVELRPNGEFSDAELEALFAASWPGDASPCFSLDASWFWVTAHAGERLVGFVNVVGDGGRHAFLIDTTVHPDFRGHGVGRGLVRCAVDEARELGVDWLHVDYAAEHARFYRRCGFEPTLAGLIALAPSEPSEALQDELRLRRYAAEDADACRELMAGLSNWFVIPSASEAYLADLPRLPTWVATLGGAPHVAGFISLAAPQPRAFEVHVLAVARQHHRRGIGRALMQLVESWSAQQGARFLQVKTLGPSHPDLAYRETREFYLRLGYEPLLETDKFWGAGNPTLWLVKALL